MALLLLMTNECFTIWQLGNAVEAKESNELDEETMRKNREKLFTKKGTPKANKMEKAKSPKAKGKKVMTNKNLTFIQRNMVLIPLSFNLHLITIITAYKKMNMTCSKHFSF